MGGVPWTKEEDNLLKKCILQYGEGNWHRLPLLSGLKRCRKSCRLRWLNYLRPNIRRGSFSHDEVQLILKLHKLVGNRWTIIAGRLPGRTANDVKNYWNCHLSKKLLNTHQTKDEEDSKVMMTRNEQQEEEAPSIIYDQLESNNANANAVEGLINSTIPIISNNYVCDADESHHFQKEDPINDGDDELQFMESEEFQPLQLQLQPTNNRWDNWDDFNLDLDLI